MDNIYTFFCVKYDPTGMKVSKIHKWRTHSHHKDLVAEKKNDINLIDLFLYN